MDLTMFQVSTFPFIFIGKSIFFLAYTNKDIWQKSLIMTKERALHINSNPLANSQTRYTKIEDVDINQKAPPVRIIFVIQTIYKPMPSEITEITLLDHIGCKMWT